MKWGRVKWLLILCLLAADIFLGIQLMRQHSSTHTVSRSSVEDASAILAGADIIVGAETVPAAIVRDYVYRIPADNDILQTAFSALTDSPLVGTYLQPSSGMSMVFENGDSAEYYQNLYFTFSREGADTALWSALAEDCLSGTKNFLPAAGGRARDAEKTAEVFLDRMTDSKNLTADTVRLRPRTEGVYHTEYENVYLVVLTQEISAVGGSARAGISGTRVCVVTEGETVWYISGTWIPVLPEETFSTAKLGQLDILFSEMRRKGASEVTAAERWTLREMERTYYMLWDDGSNVYLRPAWGFVYEMRDGVLEAVLCDAVTGSMVSQGARMASAEGPGG